MARRIGIVSALVLLVATAGVVVFGLATRSAGQQQLADVLARHAAAGYGSSPTDLAAMAPAVDADRQARTWAWMSPKGGTVPVYRVKRDPAWWRDGRSPEAEARAAHEAFRPEVEALEALFAEGQVCLTSLGWLPDDLEAATLPELLGGHIPNLLRMRSAWTWVQVETAWADDPGPALATLQRLHASTDRCGCLIDAMVTVACDALRDDTYVLLAGANRCPDDAVAAWLAEPPRAARLVADGLRGERLLFGAALARVLVAGGTVAEGLGVAQGDEGPEDLWSHHVLPWVVASSDCAAHLEAMVALERLVRGEIGHEELAPKLAACEDLGHPFDLMMPNAKAIEQTAAGSAARHVMVRAAVALARGAELRGEVPVTHEAALARLQSDHPGLLPDRRHVAFVYERLAPDRFRVREKGDDVEPPAQAAAEPIVLRHDVVEIGIP